MAMARGAMQVCVPRVVAAAGLRSWEGVSGMVAFQGLRARGAVHGVGQVRAMPVVERARSRAVAVPRRAGVRCDASGSNGAMGGRNHSGMNLVFVSAEVASWSKTGGLGDVLGGLPPALAARGHRVMAVSPRYDQYKDAWDTNTPTEITIGDRTETVNFFHTHKRGVDRIFVDHPLFLAKVWGKTGSKIYGPSSGEDYDDNQFRFMLLAKAAIEDEKLLQLIEYYESLFHKKLLLHNIFRMQWPSPCYSYTKSVKGRKINWMKAGFLESDLNMTVSPNYAAELVSREDKGVELDSIIRKQGIVGICNGMDVQEWDPSADKYLDTPYDITTVFQAKPMLKEALQAEVGLPIKRDVPLFGFIGRLEEQKGSDILAEAVKDFLKDDVQLIVLGTGKKHLEKQLEELDSLFPGKAVGVVKFNTPLAHMITAGADFFLVPSRFEPCGLIQLHAMRYGTVPVVASTGGFVDTVKEGVTGFQVGIAFNVDCEKVDPEDVELLSATVKKAVEAYGSPQFKTMIKSCMDQDLWWKGPARQWEETLLGLQVEGSGPGQEGEEIAPKAKANVAAP